MKSTTFILALFIFCTSLSAQVGTGLYKHYLDVGLTAGVLTYSGDLSEKDIDLRQARPAFGVFGRYQLSQSFLVKGQFLSGRIFGDDKNSTGHAGRKFRINGPLYELSFVLEYAPFYFGNETSEGKSYYFFPYIFAGVGGTYVKPKLKYYGSPDEQASAYREPIPEGGKETNTFLSTPLGGGIRLNINGRTTIGLEAGLRPVYSDLLDGVSLNGNPGFNDWYYYGGVTASYYLGHDWKLRE